MAASSTNRRVKILILISVALFIFYCLNSWSSRRVHQYSKLPRQKAAILYLIIDREEDNFRKSISLLHENFNQQHKYPVIAFHETYYPRDKLAKLKADLQLVEPLLQFEEIVFNFPKHYEDKPPYIDYGYPGYNYMIHWWFMDVLNHPLVSGLDYYFRLDTDSFIHSKVQFDPFKFMAAYSIKYGYRTTTVRDVASVCQGMVDKVSDFIEANPISKQISQINKLEIPEPEDRAKYAPFMMYTNFELVHIPTFKNRAAFEVLANNIESDKRNQEMSNFVDVIDKTNKIFSHRWGDAPLRYFQVYMFLLPSEIWEFCSVKYEHQHHNLVFKACHNDRALQ